MSKLGVEPVFRLVENLGGVALEHIRRNFLSPVGGQAVLDHTARICQIQQFLIDLEARERLHPDGLLLLLAHGGPYVSQPYWGVRQSWNSKAGSLLANSSTFGSGS